MRFKRELAQKLHKEYGFKHSEAKVIYDIFVEAFIDHVTDDLDKAGEVMIPHMGAIAWRKSKNGHSFRFKASNLFKQVLYKKWEVKQGKKKKRKMLKNKENLKKIKTVWGN